MHLFCCMPCRVVPPLVLRHEFHLQWGRQKDQSAQNGWLPVQAKPVAVILDPGRLHFGIQSGSTTRRDPRSVMFVQRAPTFMTMLIHSLANAFYDKANAFICWKVHDNSNTSTC